MKTIVRFCMAGCLVLAGVGYAAAQSAASSSRDFPPTENNSAVATIPQTDTVDMSRPDRGIPMPSHIEKLFQDGKVSEALVEFNKFKATQQKTKANPFDLLYLEMTVYEHAASNDYANSKQYGQKADAIRLEIIEKYPNVSDTYLLQIDMDTPDEKVVELATKAIELDPENTGAYNYRGRALLNLKKTKEACADFEKLPWKGNMPEYWQCKDLK